MNQKLALPTLLVCLSFLGCNDPNDAGVEISQKLNAAAEIAAEIGRAHEIECHAYYKIAEEAGQIELHLSDSELDHQSLLTEIAKLPTVRSFDGKLYVVLRHTEDGSDTPAIWVKVDAKTGALVQP
jgi:hypothetical protein